MSKKIENKEVETVVEVEVEDLEEVEATEAVEVEEESGEGKKKRFGGFKKNAKKFAIGAGLLVGGVLLGRTFAAKSTPSEDEVDGDVDEEAADVEITEF